MDDNYFSRSYRGEARRLVKALAELYPELSYDALMRLFRKKDISVNGKSAAPETIISKGDNVSLYLRPAEIKLKEIYSDGNILILYKNKGVVSEGEYSFEGLIKYKYGADVRLTHRLDTNTDGLLIFAYGEAVYRAVYDAMRDKNIEKYYYARVHGRVADKEKTLRGYLSKDSEKGVVRIYDRPTKGAEYVEMYFKTLSYSDGASLLDVKLLGGKTHQIRAQLAHYGHFILGDGKYGNDTINRRYRCKKQLLTAYKIVFNTGNSEQLAYLNGKSFEV